MTRRVGAFLAFCLAVLCVVAWLSRSHETVPASNDGVPSGIVGASGGDRQVAPEQVEAPSTVFDTPVQSNVDSRGLSSGRDVDRLGAQDGDQNRSDRVEAQVLGVFSRQPNLGITSIDARCGQTDCAVQLTGLKPRTANQLLREIAADDLLHAFMKNEDLSLDAERRPPAFE